MEIKISKEVKSALKFFSNNGDVEKAFTPLLTNLGLKTSFTKLSKESPILQKSLKSLENTFSKKDFSEFLKRYLEFYSNVNIVSDELSLIIEKSFDKIEDFKLSIVVDEKIEKVSSKSLLGSMLFLVMTSNEDIFSKSFDRLEVAIQG